MNITTRWQCDSCGEPILDPRDGWLEWQAAEHEGVKGPRAKGLRIVHAFASSPQRYRESRCSYERAYHTSNHSEYVVRYFALAEMTGPDGLQFFLRLIGEGNLPKDALLEMIRRVHVPGYEHARLHFDEAIRTYAIYENDRLDSLEQETIKKILDHVPDPDDCDLCRLSASR